MLTSAHLQTWLVQWNIRTISVKLFQQQSSCTELWLIFRHSTLVQLILLRVRGPSGRFQCSITTCVSPVTLDLCLTLVRHSTASGYRLVRDLPAVSRARFAKQTRAGWEVSWCFGKQSGG